MSAPEEAAAQAVPVLLSVSTGRVTVHLLSTLADLPSTPEQIAKEAADRARRLDELLPMPAPGQHSHPSVELPAPDAVGIAGLLELLGGMPSTPPLVTDDARDRAEELWALLGVPSQK